MTRKPVSIYEIFSRKKHEIWRNTDEMITPEGTFF